MNSFVMDDAHRVEQALDRTVALEDLHKALLEKPTGTDAPLVIQVSLFEKGVFRSDEEIESDIALSKTYYPATRKVCVWKTAGG